MIARATARYIRITPRKFRQIVPLIKGRPVEEALAICASINKKASVYAEELLKSVLANAKNTDKDIDTSNLFVSKLSADCGPTFKRFRAGSMGRASTIRKRTSHLTAELDEIEHKPKVKEHKQKAKSKTAKAHVKAAPAAKGK